MKTSAFPGTVILADGSFPVHEIPLGILRNASRIICCDGAAESLIEHEIEPFAIVGDCDSLSLSTSEKYSDRIFRYSEQETNDLTKAVKWCSEKGYSEIVILGATGKREDHALGNISLLADYAGYADVMMVTDTGTFHPLKKGKTFKVKAGQQISVFSIDPATEITSTGLKYPLKNMKLTNWWQATLNEAAGNQFSLEFEGGPVIVFLAFS
jgi:thiamine pyrophosphokinase